MSPKALLEPILENGIKNTNFFEGRLLSGRDLQDQQIADRTRHRQIGRAVGAGVIEGLEVEVTSDGSDGSTPELKVTAGIALTAKGDILQLAQDENISLTRTLEVIVGTGDVFFNCLVPPTASIPNGAGIYILVMSHASGFRERAPKSGLGDDGIVKGCGSRYVVEGVQFRLVELNPANLDSITSGTRDNILLGDLLSAGSPASVSEPARLSKLRNILAHLCFGTETLKNFPTNPFALESGQSAYFNYNALDDLHRLELLNNCDVPLALFYWNIDGIAFLDLWSVRRRPYGLAPSALWPTLVSPHRMAEAEARFFQFQEQIAHLTSGALTQVERAAVGAVNYFRYLPAAGIMPVTISSLRQYHRQKAGKIPDALTGTDWGFDFKVIFRDMTVRDPVFVKGEGVEHIIHESFKYPSVSPGSEEMIWLYLVGENVESIINNVSSPPQAYLVFTNGHMPFYGKARYDLSRWDYSNYV